MPSKYKPAQIAFRYRTADSPAGVTRETALRVAETLGVDETQAIHLALHEMAVRVLPQYAPDDGPLTAAQQRQVRKLAGRVAKGQVHSTLVDVDAS
jgi:broad specificity phosphatase PhoE